MPGLPREQAPTGTRPAAPLRRCLTAPTAAAAAAAAAAAGVTWAARVRSVGQDLQLGAPAAAVCRPPCPPPPFAHLLRHHGSINSPAQSNTVENGRLKLERPRRFTPLRHDITTQVTGSPPFRRGALSIGLHFALPGTELPTCLTCAEKPARELVPTIAPGWVFEFGSKLESKLMKQKMIFNFLWGRICTIAF